jgi:hypothetical protein
LLVAVGAAVGGVAAYYSRKRSEEQRAEWRRQIVQVVNSTMIARDLVISGTMDTAFHSDTKQQVQSAAQSAESLATIAPNKTDATTLTHLSQTLRNLDHAVEAAQLLRQMPVAPSADQLGIADDNIRAHLQDLESVLAQIRASIAEENQ